MNAVDAAGLGKRYLRVWALKDCCLAIPPSRVTALVGANGAGKTTLLHLAAGLLRPTRGRITVAGGAVPGSQAALDAVAFVAHDAPLYGHLPVRDMVRVAAHLSRVFDEPRARARLADLGIPPRRLVETLSAGQRAQVALTLALARRPRLLLLDEPMASLDPLARHEFMGALMAAVATDGLSVLVSSHIVAELERIADHLVVLSHGRVQVAGDVEHLLATHATLTGPASETDEQAERLRVVTVRRAGAQSHLLVRTGPGDRKAPPGWTLHPVSLEELVLAYLREPGAGALPGPGTTPIHAGAPA